MLFPRFFLLIYNDIGDCIFACFLFVILIKDNWEAAIYEDGGYTHGQFYKYVTSTRLSRIGKAKVTCFRNESITLWLVDATKHFFINHTFIMKNDQFTLLPVCHMANDNILLLIEKCGMEGYGIYIALVGEIRLRDDYHVSSEIFS